MKNWWERERHVKGSLGHLIEMLGCMIVLSAARDQIRARKILRDASDEFSHDYHTLWGATVWGCEWPPGLWTHEEKA